MFLVNSSNFEISQLYFENRNVQIINNKMKQMSSPAGYGTRVEGRPIHKFNASELHASEMLIARVRERRHASQSSV